MATQQVNFCSNCGHSLGPGARFCSSCGLDIASSSGGSGAQTSERSLEDQIEEYLRTSLAGEYDVAGLLGKGGMAIVYRAHELMLDREVAIKVLPPEMAFGSGMVERFKREAKTAAKLNHPNIIPIYRIGQLKGTVYFVMKYVPGSGLDDLLASVGRFDVDLTATILDQVGSALAYAHRSKIIHRDIKPSNIMIDEEGWAMVMDFGIAKAGGASTLTATGAAIGTPHYMSPEQCTGKDITVLSDQYSLGVMTYQMLTGALPFEGETLPEIISKHFFEEPTPLLELAPDCPPAVADAVARALAKKPEDRFDSVDDYVRAIKDQSTAPPDEVRERMIAMVAEVGVPPEQLPPTSPVPPGKRVEDMEPTTPMPVDRGTRPSAPTTPMPVSRPYTPPPPPPTPAPPTPAITEEPTTPVPRAESHQPAASPTPAATEPAPAIPPPASGAIPEPQPAGKRQRGKGLLIGVGSLVVAAAAGGMFFALGGPARFFGSAAPEIGVTNDGGEAAAAPVAAIQPAQDTTAGERVVPQDTATPVEQIAAQPLAQAPVEEPPPPAPPADGTVRVTGAPPGARVTIGGRSIRNFNSASIPPGRHSVVITADGYETFRTSVSVRSDRQTTLDASGMTRVPEPVVTRPLPPTETPPAVDPNAHPACNLTPTIPADAVGVSALRLLDCSPGLTVRVDGRPNDDGLFELRSDGRVRIILTADGYATARVDTTITAGATLVISGELVPRN